MQKVKIKFAYKAGFRRLWATISLIWAGIGLYFHFFDGMSWSKFMQGCLLPIAALYLFGAAAVWIIEGFAKADL